jgi:SAM-dependent methyltransferase
MKICPKCSYSFNSTDWLCDQCGYIPTILDGKYAFCPKLANSSEGFESHFFDDLAVLESNNFWFRVRNKIIIWAIHKYFFDKQSLLEIGCGTGFVLTALERAFPDLEISGSEIFTNGLNFAEQRFSRGSLFQMDARAIPFVEEFDVIGAFDVLEHIQEDTKVLAEMYRATKQGIILTVPQHPWLWSQADEYAHHVQRYTAKELKSKVESAGFKVVKMTSFVSLLLPLMMISRLKPKNSQVKYDPLAELKIGNFINKTLEYILNLELILIKIGISLPLGGSLLLIAKKINIE